ncbi:MAG TPA: response regulator [Polyangia bacterium]|jgi:CheY-like chemotaxis protein|nr:response regulator [Polyangia bacterium]
MRNYLIVDDNVAFAENVAEILSDLPGVQVTVVSSGEEALKLAQATRFDVLISDMRMPLMTGAELVHRIRAIDPGLAAIVVSAYTGDDELDAARREGLLAILPKPVPMGRLIELTSRARREGLVALVDDDAALADNLSEALRGRGFTAITAQTVLACEQLAVRPFAALVDLRMPGGSDGEAMRRLAAKFPGLPLFVISAYADSAAPAGATALFAKPFATGELLGAVERMWSARHG